MEVKIGLEVHVQLNRLRSKLFCSCPTDYHDSEPNTHVCEICLGLPGAMPVVNRKAIEAGIAVALALNANIQERTLFYRKNYFYPDLPKGFQISQYDYPLALGGYVLIETENGEKRVELKRVHLEEDPGRLSYPGTIETSRYSLVDYNRSGMPLLEVVTEPVLSSPKEARSFLNKLRTILEYLGYFDGSLEGAMRVDANISVEGGARAEIKNISSYKGVEKALTFEITRQKNLLKRGMKVETETRHYDEARGITISLRTKEEEQDYRYFPEPDLVPILTGEIVDEVRERLPELPDAKRARFKEQYGISDYFAKVLTSELQMADYFERVAEEIEPSLAATWIADILRGELNYRGLRFDSAFSPEKMIRTLRLLSEKRITEKGAVKIIRTLLDEGGEPEEIVERFNLLMLPEDEVERLCEEAIRENEKAVSDYISGKKEALNFLVGQVMKKSRGKADPGLTNRILREKLGSHVVDSN